MSRKLIGGIGAGALGVLAVPFVIFVMLFGLVIIVLPAGGQAASQAQAGCGADLPVAGGAGVFMYPMAAGSYTLTSPFGPRAGGFHQGQDMGAPVGTDIFAAGDGVVIEAGAASGFGNWIVIDHDVDGQTVSTVYGHMFDDGVLVGVGDQVRAGDHIAEVGNNGESTGPHLHFEVWLGGRLSGGTATDPLPWLSEQASASAALPASNAGSIGDDLLPNPPTGPQSRLNVDAEVTANVATIVGVAKGTGMSLRAAVVAVATASQESSIRNIDFGDRDSLGLFQQRPIYGWGTPEQIMDTVLSSQAFYGLAAHTANPGLNDIAGWEAMPLTEAAQAVQNSGYSDAYAKWEQQAAELVDAARDVPAITSPEQAVGAGASPCGVTDDGGSNGPVVPPDLTIKTDWPPEQATVDDPTSSGMITPRMAALLAEMDARGFTTGGVTCWDPHPQNPASDHPLGRACDVMFGYPDSAEIAHGWELANFLVSNQAIYGVSNVIWQGQSWSARSPLVWVTYESAVYNCPDPENISGCHFDHVHVSVY